MTIYFSFAFFFFIKYGYVPAKNHSFNVESMIIKVNSRYEVYGQQDSSLKPRVTKILAELYFPEIIMGTISEIRNNKYNSGCLY